MEFRLKRVGFRWTVVRSVHAGPFHWFRAVDCPVFGAGTAVGVAPGGVFLMPGNGRVGESQRGERQGGSGRGGAVVAQGSGLCGIAADRRPSSRWEERAGGRVRGRAPDESPVRAGVRVDEDLCRVRHLVEDVALEDGPAGRGLGVVAGDVDARD